MSEYRSSPEGKPLPPRDKRSAGARPSTGLPAAQTLRSERLASALPGLQHGFTVAVSHPDDAELARELSERLGLGGGLPWLFDQPHGPDILDLGALAAGGTAEPTEPAERLCAAQKQLSREVQTVPRDACAPPCVPVQGYDGCVAQLAVAERLREAHTTQQAPPLLHVVEKGQGDEARLSRGANRGAPSGPTLVIKAADCVTVLAVYPESRAYAALHAGWRGVAAGILPRLLSIWRRQGASLSGVAIAFGPHIRSCCFEVRDDCLARFPAADLAGAVETRRGRTYLNLERVLRTQAGAFGIPAHRIEALPFCTYCYQADGAHPFASYRRAQREGHPAGRNVAYIGPAT